MREKWYGEDQNRGVQRRKSVGRNKTRRRTGVSSEIWKCVKRERERETARGRPTFIGRRVLGATYECAL